MPRPTGGASRATSPCSSGNKGCSSSRASRAASMPPRMTARSPTGTVAVLAGGIDIVYPEENRALHEQIAERGVLIAEMPVGTEPQARHFPRRNRIISGASARRPRGRGGDCARARSSPRASRSSRAARSSPCRARRSIRAAAAPTISSATARLWSRAVDDILRELTPLIGTSLVRAKARRARPQRSPHAGRNRSRSRARNDCRACYRRRRCRLTNWCGNANCRPRSWSRSCSNSNWPDASSVTPAIKCPCFEAAQSPCDAVLSAGG